MLRRQRPDATESDEELRGTKRRRREGRGLGPFSGGQLTVVIVAIAAVFAIPTAALAAGGSFSNNSATVPALKASNSNAHGIGVAGHGKRYGVFSNGPLGVAAGKQLTCGACVSSADLVSGSVGPSQLAAGSVGSSALAAGSVGPTALSAAAKATQPLASGESESGYVVGYDQKPASQTDSLVAAVTYVRPVPGTLIYQQGPTANCPGVGSAASGYFCIYPWNTGGISGNVSGFDEGESPHVGAVVFASEAAVGESYFEATYTVQAP